MPRFLLPPAAFALLALSLALAPGAMASDPDPEPPRKYSLESILKACPKDEDAIERLYLSLLRRKPNAEEKAKLLAAIQKWGNRDRREMFKDIEWALVNSREYLLRKKDKAR